MIKISSRIKKSEVPNTIAVIASCFASMHENNIDYRSLFDALELKAKTKTGAGYAKQNKTPTIGSKEERNN